MILERTRHHAGTKKGADVNIRALHIFQMTSAFSYLLQQIVQVNGGKRRSIVR